MAERDSTPEVTISKTQRRVKVGYVGIIHTTVKPKFLPVTREAPASTTKATGSKRQDLIPEQA